MNISAFIHSERARLSRAAVEVIIRRDGTILETISEKDLLQILNGIYLNLEKDYAAGEDVPFTGENLSKFCTRKFGSHLPFKIPIPFQQIILSAARDELIQSLMNSTRSNREDERPGILQIFHAFDGNLQKLTQIWHHAIHRIQKEDLSLIEDLKLVKNDLQRQLNIIYQLIKSSPIPVVACDGDLNVQLWNPMASKLTGYQQADILKKSLLYIFSAASRKKLMERIAANRKTNSKLRLKIQGKNKISFPALVSINKIEQAFSNRILYVISFLDLRDELIIRSQSRRINQLTSISRLSSSIMHDIRNPINSIGLNLEVLEKLLKQADESLFLKTREVLQAIYRQIDQLSENLNQYLGYSRLADLNTRPINFTTHLNDLVADFRVENTSKLIRIDYKPIKKTHWINGDWPQLRRVFMNLLQNAVESIQSEGHISIQFLKRKNRIMVKVSDSGPGIKVGDRRKIFEPFYSTKPFGTGLGLFIAREIVHAHGGRLTVSSAPGRGAQFTVSLPVLEDDGHFDDEKWEEVI
ncbi:MAG: hypothetical protein Kow0042_06110 [Calditrichia bacterium]